MKTKIDGKSLKTNNDLFLFLTIYFEYFYPTSGLKTIKAVKNHLKMIHKKNSRKKILLNTSRNVQLSPF